MKSGRQKPAKSNASKGYVMESRRWGMIVRHMNPAPSRRFSARLLLWFLDAKTVGIKSSRILYSNTSLSACLFCENIFLSLPCQAIDRHIESVFALSLIENVAIFHEERTTNGTHFLFGSWTGHILRARYSISIQVWGIASFILFGFATTFN